ncbi:uncharacterized protein K02A2.6-like [Toxorhynchites rutilus septentrionalis]|uniref:uncharacterized protein K02A2.6-like n=1 Tax=Toxorhynchites rutilus septentrionalis TaxID=329112 RepID=UPI002479094B|nr:uncharacterized protein K02A2.6-like [Toxorhynchites rutilus septentrionalis]
MDVITRQQWGALEPFNDAADQQDLRREWEEWRRSFELFLELKHVESQHEKLLLLLSQGGRGLQRIYYNLGPSADEYYPEPVKVPLMPPEVPEYDNAIKRLNKFFIGKRNDRIELEVFRSLKQRSDEPFNQFVLRLRAQAVRCDFLEREDREMLQQITMGAYDERVRDKGLESTMDLDALTNYAINREILLKQKERVKGQSETAVAMVEEKTNGTIICMIDKFPVNFLIDSGSAINTVTEKVWNILVTGGAAIFKRKFQCDRRFIPYATQTPLNVVAVFEAWITVNDTKPKCYAEFFVVEGANKSLLSKSTAEFLKVLKVGLDVQNIEMEKDPFPKFPNVQVKLSIDNSVPPRKIVYLRIPEPMKKKVDEKILEMLRTDVIEPAQGPAEWISPMVVVPKGKDDIRLCINMRYPNQAIHREHYPLPVIETLLNKLRGTTYFSKLDITSAYHHIELHPDSRSITTFMTERGLMRFKRMMFGINCAPEIFQRIMTEMLAGVDGVIVYIDDIVIAARTLEEHDQRLKQVLLILRQNNAKLNEGKCLFRVRELEILGFKVSAAGISPSDEKVAAIKNFRTPTNKEEVRSFLGLVNFVGHFIPRLSTRSEPLRQYLRGDVLDFGNEQKEAFDDLRNELSNGVRRLGYFDPKDVTELYIDASPVGLGAVLVQRDPSSTPRIICFASKGLTPTERVYPQTQREALAVVWAVEKLYFYLFGLHFTIFTDHKTLEYIFGGKHQDGRRATTRAEGWALRLQPYDFEIKYISGTSNISDILSRLNSNSDPPFDDNAEHYLCSIGEEPSAITLDDIRNEMVKDEILIAVTKALQSGDWPQHLIRYESFAKELGVINGILVRDERIILPTSLRPKALDIIHRGHPGVVTMRRALREKVWWPGMDDDVTGKIQECAGCIAVSVVGPPEPIQRKEMPDRAWQEIAIDFFSAKECATFLIVVDYYSRFIRVIEMKTTTAAKTIEALESIFAEHTYPETIRSDNGPPFSSEVFASYCSSKNIRLIRTIPYWPQMNGLVERQNQGILRTLRIARATKSDWRKAIKEYVYMYNTTPHSVTRKAPMELLTGRPVKDLLPSLRTDPHWHREEGVRERDTIEKLKGKKYADQRRHARTSEIEEGDDVVLKNNEHGKLEPKFKLDRFKVISRSGNDTVVKNKEGVTLRRCVTHLKKWTGLDKTVDNELESDSPPDLEQPHSSEELTPSQPLQSDSLSHSSLPSSLRSSKQTEGRQSDRQHHCLKRTRETSTESSTKRPDRNRKVPSRYVQNVSDSRLYSE